MVETNSSQRDTEKAELRKENRLLIELLEFIRDEVVFGNRKHVERINDVINKKIEQKGS